MKKIINISLITLLCFGLALSLVGCGKASREFSMDGHNLSSLDSDLIIKKIVDAEKLKTAEIYVNADNFELRLTSDFDWADDGAIRFFYKEKQNTYSVYRPSVHGHEIKAPVAGYREFTQPDAVFRAVSGSFSSECARYCKNPCIHQSAFLLLQRF